MKFDGKGNPDRRPTFGTSERNKIFVLLLLVVVTAGLITSISSKHFAAWFPEDKEGDSFSVDMPAGGGEIPSFGVPSADLAGSASPGGTVPAADGTGESGEAEEAGPPAGESGSATPPLVPEDVSLFRALLDAAEEPVPVPLFLSPDSREDYPDHLPLIGVLFDLARRSPQDAIAEASIRDVTFWNFSNPTFRDAMRGRPVRVAGYVDRIQPVDYPDNPLGIERVYFTVLVGIHEKRKYSYFIYLLDPPEALREAADRQRDAFRAGESDKHYHVPRDGAYYEVDAFFVCTAEFTSRVTDGPVSRPAFIGNGIAVVHPALPGQVSSTAEAAFPMKVFAWIVVGIVVGLTLILGVSLLRERRQERAFRQRVWEKIRASSPKGTPPVGTPGGEPGNGSAKD